MSIEMCIEVEDLLESDKLIQAFKNTGMHEFVAKEYGFSGYFPESGLSVYVFQKEKDTVLP